MLTALEGTALWLSLKVALVAVLGAAPFAVAAAALLALREFPGKFLLSALLHTPLVLPPVVMGYLLLVTLGTQAPLGGWLYETFNIRFVFSWTGAALAAGIMTFPFQMRSMRLAFESIDPVMVDAAATLGAGAFDRFRTIIMPLALPGILAGLMTAFAAALGEFGAIITFVSNIPGETQTLPLAIYSAVQTPGGEAAAARLSLLAVVLAVAGLVAAESLQQRLMRRRAGR